jgi:DNA polymerase-1
MDKATRKLWKLIRDENCELCGLSATAQYACLLGDGPCPSKILAIGEAPGWREEKMEKPFQGAAGQYLDKVLTKVGLKRSDIYITNVVKCRPPENRRPTPTEMEACGNYLAREIQAVNPEWILILGGTALSMLNQSGVMKLRGTIIRVGPIKYFITIHPSACLHNPLNRPLFEKDMERFAHLVTGQNEHTPKTHIRIVRGPKGLHQMLAVLKESDCFAYDLEWYGEPWSEGGITCLGIAPKVGEAWCCLLDHPEAKWKDWRKVLQRFGPLLTDPSKKSIAHNGKSDNVWLRAYGIPMQHTFDTMPAAHLIDENRSMSLENLSRTMLGTEEYKAKADVKKGRNLDGRLLAGRNGRDCDYTLRLYYVLRDQLNEQARLRRIFRHISMPITDILADIELEGMVLDLKKLKSTTERNEAERQELIRALRGHVPRVWKDQEKAEAHKKKGFKINFNSTQWVGNWLFGSRSEGGLGLKNPQQTPSGRFATGEDALLTLPGKQHPVIRLLLDYRLREKYRSTYLEAWADRMDASGRVHISYNQTGTVTGRMSSDIHTTPRDGFIRSIWTAPPGWGFGQADYSQVEMRLAAMAAQDRTMLRMFAEGRDPHTETAQEVLDTIEVTPEQRKKAKAVNFGYLYGMGHKKFQQTAREKYGLDLPLEECARYRDRWMRRYSNIPRWHDRQRRLFHRYGEVTSAIGRKRRPPQDDAEGERQAINSPIQGLANDMTMFGGVLCKKQVNPNNFKIIGFVHDAMLFFYRLGQEETVLPIIKETMENLPLRAKFGTIMTVPIEVEIKIGTHWGEGKPWTNTQVA